MVDQRSDREMKGSWGRKTKGAEYNWGIECNERSGTYMKEEIRKGRDHKAPLKLHSKV